MKKKPGNKRTFKAVQKVIRHKQKCKEELIEKAFNLLFADDDPKNDDSNLNYLNSLMIDQLEDLIARTEQ